MDFARTKAAFHLPKNTVYLAGNSLGPLPHTASERVLGAMRDNWGDMLITGWNKAGWMSLSTRIGDRIGRLVGAEPGHVVMGDTLSIKVYQALAAALNLNPERKIVLSDSGNFPTDLYMAQGLLETLGNRHELRIVSPQEIEENITSDVAVLMLTEVDYRTGRLHDMHGLTKRAHAQGVITVWDLAHSAGAIPVDLARCGADFAVGCTYKYLNGGPGAPAFIYVAPKWVKEVRPALSGWLGHEVPFDFDLGYRPHAGIERMRVGTPPVIALNLLEAALDVWDGVDIHQLREKSLELSDLFISEMARRCPDIGLACPANGLERGSQVSFSFTEGYATMQALIARGVIGDFRAPDIIRFGITPLYVGANDILRAVDVLEDVITNRLWDRPEYHVRAEVT